MEKIKALLTDEMGELNPEQLLELINSQKPKDGKHQLNKLHTDLQGKFFAGSCLCGISHPVVITYKTAEACWINKIPAHELQSFMSIKKSEDERVWVLL